MTSYIVFKSNEWGYANGGAEDIVNIFDSIDDAINFALIDIDVVEDECVDSYNVEWSHIYDVNNRTIVWDKKENNVIKERQINKNNVNSYIVFAADSWGRRLGEQKIL